MKSISRLSEEMERNPKMLRDGEDVAGNKGGRNITTNERFDEKIGMGGGSNSPLAEASIVGTAFGACRALRETGGGNSVPGDYIWPTFHAVA